MLLLETFMGAVQKTGAGSNPHISCVVSKSDRDHGTATTDNRTLGLTPAGTISRSYLSLGLNPLPRGGEHNHSLIPEMRSAHEHCIWR